MAYRMALTQWPRAGRTSCRCVVAKSTPVRIIAQARIFSQRFFSRRKIMASPRVDSQSGNTFVEPRPPIGVKGDVAISVSFEWVRSGLIFLTPTFQGSVQRDYRWFSICAA